MTFSFPFPSSLLKLPNDFPMVLFFLQSSLGIWCNIRKSFVVSPCYQLQSKPSVVADKRCQLIFNIKGRVWCLSLCLRTFAPKSSYGEIFFISRLELGHKVLTPKMKKKKTGVTYFVSEKMAVEKCHNFEKSVIIARCRLICSCIENHKNKLLEWKFPCIGF